MTDDEFLTAFEKGTLARKVWTHEAHVRMAWLYLTRLPFSEALEKVRSGIRKLNDVFAQRAKYSCLPSYRTRPDGGGYHETITVAFVRVIAARLVAGEDYPAFRDRNPDLSDRALEALLRYYSRDRLDAAEARTGFVEPDREPLPGPAG